MMNEVPRLIETDEGHTILYKGKYLYSPDKPCSSAARRVESVVIPRKAIVFIPSPLLFYGVKELFNKLPPDSHLLCVETDQTLMALSIRNVHSSLYDNPRISYVRVDTPAAVRRVLKTIGIWNFRKAVLVRTSRGYSLDTKQYNALFSAVESEIRRFWRNKITTIHLAELWFRNIFRNLHHLCTGHHLESLSVNKPVVVVGAGESLETSLPLLSRMRNQVFILCVDTALPVLVASGIVPDAVCVVEAQFINIKDFIGCGDVTVPVLCDLTSHPAALTLLKGPKYFFVSLATEASLLKRLKEGPLNIYSVPPLGSVGVVACYLAMQLTAESIFITGFNFSYSLGKPHSRGTISHTEMLLNCDRLHPLNLYSHSINRPLQKTKDKNGKIVRSDSVLLSYVQELKDLIQPADRVYDMDSGGMKTGARPMDETLLTEKQNECFLQEIDDGKSRTTETSLDPQVVLSFLDEEKNNIERAIILGKRQLLKKQNRETDQTLIETLKTVDYVFSHFPDPNPLPPAEPAFIKRVLVSLYRYQRLIEKCRHLVLGCF